MAERRPNVVQVTRDLVRIPSHEGTVEVGKYIEQFATDHALQIREIPSRTRGGRIDRRNPSFVVGHNLDRMPRVLGASHIDTVDPWNRKDGEYDPHGATIVEGKMYGRGTSDATGGAAALLVALVERRHPNTAVLLTSREETDLGGAKSSAENFRKLQERDPKGKTVLVMDSGTDEHFGTGSRGVLEADIFIRGKTEHTARPTDFVNAIDMRELVIAHLQEQVSEMPIDPLLGPTKFIRTADSSGMRDGKGGYKASVNRVPDGASALLTFRLTREGIDGQPLNSATLEGIIEQYIAQYAHEGVELEGYRERLYVPGFISDPESVRWIVDHIQRTTGKQLQEKDYGQRGLSEANHLMTAFPEASLMIVGPGKQGTYHKIDEHVEVESLEAYTQIFGDIFVEASK